MSQKTTNVQQAEGLAGQVNGQALTVQDIVGEAVNQPSAEEQARAERLAMLEAVRITTQTEVAPEAYSLSVDGTGFFALGDIHGLKGKQKSGKSAALKVCLAALLGGSQFRVKSELESPTVLFLDTEQQAADVKLIISELKHMTQLPDETIDRQLRLFPLRRMSYDTLLDDTRLLVEAYHPQVVFIDGLVDFVASFNDEVLSRALIHDLLLICEEAHCAIVNVLHENKATDDENMRGHLGTVLSQKAGTVLQCRKSKDGIIQVSCPDSRHGTMPPWHISFDADGHICSADEQWLQEQRTRHQSQVERNQERRELRDKARLDTLLEIIRSNGGHVARTTLKKELMRRQNIGDSTAQAVIKQHIGQELTEINGELQASDNVVLPF